MERRATGVKRENYTYPDDLHQFLFNLEQAVEAYMNYNINT